MLGLGIGLTLGSGNRGGAAAQPSICDAIQARKCITVKDGDTVLKLAPHIVYKWTKKEIITLDASLLERDGRPVNKVSLRRYPVEDLSELVILDEGFTVAPDFDASDLAYSRGTICVVQLV